MPRIRTIKPEHVTDRELPKISLQAHLLWILMWPFSDDAGVIDSDPLYLKSTLFPRRTDIRIEEMNKWLTQLVNARYIVPFEFQGEGYYIHRTFKQHQRIDKPQPSKIPVEVLESIFQEDSENAPRMLLPVKDSIVEESKGEERINARESDLEFQVMEYFGFNEITNPDKLRLVSEFCKALSYAQKVNYFKNQFEAYKEFKSLSKSIVHSFPKFIGKQENRFMDGAWNDENWIQRLKQEKEKQAALSQPRTGPAQSITASLPASRRA